MKTQFRVILVFCLSLLAAAHAAKADTEIKCRPDGVQAELNQCAHEEFQKQDKELNRLYNQIIQNLSSDGDKETLKKAQQNWLKYRDASCDYESGPRDGAGSIWPFVHMNCMAKYTEERVKHLRYYAACEEGDMSCPR